MVGIVADEEADDDGEAAAGRPNFPARLVDENHKSQKISQAQVETIKDLEKKLDDACKKKLYAWLESSYKIKKIEDLPIEPFQKVLTSFENAVKFIDQQKQEAVNA